MSAEILSVGPLGQLAKALAAAQLEMKDAKKDAVNPHFKNRYATLSAVREAVTGPLAKHGIAVVQTFEPAGEAGVCVVTTLLHESGGSIESRLYLPVQKKDAQGMGSAISYGRRYSLAAICGIASDDDDDANAATAKTNGTAPAPPESKPEAASPEAEAMLATLFDAAKTVDDLAKVTQQTSEAVKVGALTDAARRRLREKMAAATKRVSAS